jgi:signal transduction histidine kinase
VLRPSSGTVVELVADPAAARTRCRPRGAAHRPGGAHNALRHAGAQTRDRIRLAAADGCLVLEVADDGAGFDPEDPELRARHLGLTSMEERAERLGGTLTISSSIGAGTTIRLEVRGA